MKTQISYIKAASGCTGCTGPMSWIPVLHIYPPLGPLPSPFIVSGVNEGLIHGQPLAGNMENSEAGNTKTILKCHKKSRKKQWKILFIVSPCIFHVCINLYQRMHYILTKILHKYQYN